MRILTVNHKKAELDLIFTLSSLKVIIVRFWIDLIFAFFYMQVITDYHDVLD